MEKLGFPKCMGCVQTSNIHYANRDHASMTAHSNMSICVTIYGIKVTYNNNMYQTHTHIYIYIYIYAPYTYTLYIYIVHLYVYKYVCTYAYIYIYVWLLPATLPMKHEAMARGGGQKQRRAPGARISGLWGLTSHGMVCSA